MVKSLVIPRRYLWVALIAGLGFIAYLGPTAILAKAYAFFGSVALAWPFFRQNRLRKGRSNLRKVIVQKPEDQKLVDAAAERIEREEAEWSCSDTISMEGGIVALLVSFFIDLCLALNINI